MEKQRELYVIKVFAISVSLLMMKNTIVAGVEFLYEVNSLLNLIIFLVSLFLYAYAIIIKDKHKVYFKPIQLLIIICILLFWGITLIFNRTVFSYSFAREEMEYFLVNCFPALFILPTMNSARVLLDEFYRIRWIMFAVAFVTVVSMVINGEIQGSGTRVAEYSMSFGRALIMPTLLFISHWKKEGKAIDFFAAIILTLFVFLFGSRFPLLCILSFYIWKSLQQEHSRHTLVRVFFLCIFVLLISMEGKTIAEYISLILNKYGINSRAIVLLLSGNFGYDDSRLQIYRAIIEKVNESPIWGYGAFGGNYVTNNGLSHSFYLDVFANFGYVFGLIILMISFQAILKLYVKNKSFYDREFIIICICQFLPISPISMSFWRATYYWFLIAMCIGKMNSYVLENDDERST